MKNTTAVMEELLQTLDVEAFIKGVQEFDRVTQRQCLLKALKELRQAGVLRLFGKGPIKSVIQRIRDVLEIEVGFRSRTTP